MYTKHDRRAARVKRHQRVRKHIAGTAERPRLALHRSLHHISAQLVDDTSGRTIAAASTTEADLRKSVDGAAGPTVAAASVVGRAIAERARDRGIEAVVFDRGGYLYHGRVRALAEAAREAGLRF
ncbi:MAG: 50S ribosomal protein L18 [Candidatus Dormibacteraeota bacterium]|nr:50S ribosomal protein L18 [Candidatus Dormibacteraeota bacterium]MBV9526286.1 50S ribosomal protein L18 [Candidatus Dormibacteraeota bacterium]